MHDMVDYCALTVHNGFVKLNRVYHSDSNWKKFHMSSKEYLRYEKEKRKPLDINVAEMKWMIFSL